MADFKYVTGFAQLESFLQELPVKVERNILRGSLRAGANVIRLRYQQAVHRRTGRTAASAKVGTRKVGGQVAAYVVVKDPAGMWLEYGTRPHRIAPKTKKALVIGGKVVAHVNHPGTKPYRALRPALDQGANAALVAAAEYMKARLATQHGLDTADISSAVQE